MSWEKTLEFRLTYEGTLLAESSTARAMPARATHKHEIRKKFHPQLKRLWEIHPFLSLGLEKYDDDGPIMSLGRPPATHRVETLADRFKINDYRFVPLITKDAGIFCSIDVLFLRSDPPGSIIRAGDIDNRLKTLFDGLTMPTDPNQLGSSTSPEAGEDPFFCLLEDDSLITRASVETDTLLDTRLTENDVNGARVVVSVKARPYEFSLLGLGFL